MGYSQQDDEGHGHCIHSFLAWDRGFKQRRRNYRLKDEGLWAMNCSEGRNATLEYIAFLRLLCLEAKTASS